MKASIASLAVVFGASGWIVGCRPCEEIKQDAEDLVAEYEACRTGDSCEVVNMTEHIPDSCLGPFQCARAFNAARDLEQFSREAQALEKDFSTCGECVQAACIDPSRYQGTCDSATGRCRLEERP